MDINTLRSVATVLVAVAFFAVCWWAFSPSRRKQFDEAAQLPFADEPTAQGEDASPSSADETKK